MKSLIDNFVNNDLELRQISYPKLIEKLLEKEKLSEIIINPDGSILIEQDNILNLISDKLSKNDIEKLIDFISYFNNKSLGYNNPIFDGTLPKGVRVNVISKPVTKENYIITLRIKSIESVSMGTLLELNTLTEETLAILKDAIVSKKNILIAGGTSSGKTTLLNALLKEIPHKEKVVILEDTPEIDYKTPYISKLNTVNSIENKLDIDLGMLVKATLRMRPDRIIVGEIRGTEAYHLLHAMNTGHSGVLSTIHANSGRDALRRLEILSILGHKNLDIKIPRNWIKSNIDLIVYMEKYGKTRQIKEIKQIEGLEDDMYILERIL